jgi:hypothetical protein
VLGNLANIAVWALLAVSVIIVGWDEPLRYKFMSREQIIQSESSYAVVKRAPDFRSWSPSKSMLEPNKLEPAKPGGMNGGGPHRTYHSH